MTLFERHRIEEIPPLAWLFSLAGETGPELHHGRGVEVYEDGFLEGCFPGDWANTDVRQAADIFGSALKIDGETFSFITPSHTIEALYVYDSPRGYAVSNSLSYLLEFQRLPLPWDYGYGRRFATLVLGLDRYEKSVIRLGARGRILRVVCDNIVIRGRSLSFVRKPIGGGFSTYSEYVQCLQDVLAASFRSAADSRRGAQYTPIGTCSSGYDSNAATALARDLGCADAVTLRTARGGEPDSGKDVAEALGLSVREFELAETVESPSIADLAQFGVTGTGADDYSYKNMVAALGRRVVVTGFYGDLVWDPTFEPNTVFSGSDVSGRSLQEARLREDFIHIPVPMIRARRHPEIAAVSRLDEMRPFLLGSGYDRPISRRILEERGVPRSSFGRTKRAANMLVFLDPGRLPRELRRELERQVPGGPRGRLGFRIRTLTWKARRRAFLLFSTARWYLARWGVPKQAPLSVVRNYHLILYGHPLAVAQFLASVSWVRRRYRARG